MKKENIGPLSCVWTGSDSEKANHPIVVLLHGFGAPGNDLVGLGTYLESALREAPLRCLFPAAPLDLSTMYGGPESGMVDSRAWWPIDMMRLQELAMRGLPRPFKEERPPEIDDVRGMLRQSLDLVREQNPESPIVLGGFSQGAMLAFDFFLHEDFELKGLLLFSTTFLGAKRFQERIVGRPNIPIFQSHGSHDPILPFELATELCSELRERSFNVDFVGFRGQHEIPKLALDRAVSFLRTHLALSEF